MLEKVESPKLKRGRVKIINDETTEKLEQMPDTRNRYLTNFHDRVSKDNKVLYPKFIDVIWITDVSGDVFKQEQMPEEMSANSLLIWERAKQRLWQSQAGEKGYRLLTEEASFKGLHELLPYTHHDWIWFIEGKERSLSTEELPISRLRNVILNPGVLYKQAAMTKNALIHARAKNLEEAIQNNQEHNISELLEFWQADKKIVLDNHFDAMQQPDLEQWKNYVSQLTSCSMEEKGRLMRILDKIESDYN